MGKSAGNRIMDEGPLAAQKRPPEHEERAQVLYDGRCPLCLQSVAVLKRLDWFRRLAYVDVRQQTLPALDPRLNHARLLEEMHLLPPDSSRVYHGFWAFRWMAWRLPLLWPMAPFLYLPGMAKVGQRIYLWIARHRFQLVPCHGGVCAVPQPHPKVGGG